MLTRTIDEIRLILELHETKNIPQWERLDPVGMELEERNSYLNYLKEY